MAKIYLSAILLIFILTGCASNNDNYISADEYFAHQIKGDIYKIGGKTVKPDDYERLKFLADSARQNSPVAEHSVVLSDSDGTPYTLGIGLPHGFDRQRAYPLIIYLHGGIGTEISDKGGRAWEMLGGLRDCVDVIIASPSGNKFAPWWTSRGQGRIAHAVYYVNTMYAVDTAKIFLAGVSDGATGCYAAASAPDVSKMFAGFFAISGFGGMLQNLGFPLSVAYMRDRPIYNIQGGKDRLYPISAVTDFIEYLQKNGVPVTSKIYPEEEHGFDYKEREFPKLAELVREWERGTYPSNPRPVTPNPW